MAEIDRKCSFVQTILAILLLEQHDVLSLLDVCHSRRMIQMHTYGKTQLGTDQCGRASHITQSSKTLIGSSAPLTTTFSEPRASPVHLLSWHLLSRPSNSSDETISLYPASELTRSWESDAQADQGLIMLVLHQQDIEIQSSGVKMGIGDCIKGESTTIFSSTFMQAQKERLPNDFRDT